MSQKERERLRNVKNENCTCKACTTIVFDNQICKFVTSLLPSLRKLPIDAAVPGDFRVVEKENNKITEYQELVVAMNTQCNTLGLG